MEGQGSETNKSRKALQIESVYREEKKGHQQRKG